jgi:hypothetical protein
LLDLEDTIKSEINETLFSASDVRRFEPKFPEPTQKQGFGTSDPRWGRVNRQGWLLSYGIKRIILQGDGGVLSAALEDARGE